MEKPTHQNKKKQWSTLSHNGVSFPPRYVSDPRTNVVWIRGEKLSMTPMQEEMAVAWAKKKGTPYVDDPIFQTNFLHDFLELFPKKYQNVKINEIEFPVLPEKVELTKEAKKALAAERKRKRLELKEKFGYAIVDGARTEIANWVVEPAGIFMGRGLHPFRGKWKHGASEEDITLNLGRESPVPSGKWKVVNEPENMWIASWTDKLSGKVKYVWLHDSSSIRQARDKSKYDRAKKLEKDFGKVETYILKSLGSKDLQTSKIATACFLIDKLAMRVGDERDEDEADTVGASTLRVEHLSFGPSWVDFDFFGKDYVRWQKRLEVSPLELRALQNLREFCSGKKPDDLVFDGITSRQVNEFFGKASSGLTAKVFRTYTATSVVEEYLNHHSSFSETTPEYDKVFEAKLANLEAAIRCNHKRTPPKTFEQSLENKRERLRKLMETKPKTEKQKEGLEQRITKSKRVIELAERSREYNLNTSLRNYIDPRVYKRWADHVGLDWKVLYSSTLQRKMGWVESAPQSEAISIPAIQK